MRPFPKSFRLYHGLFVIVAAGAFVGQSASARSGIPRAPAQAAVIAKRPAGVRGVHNRAAGAPAKRKHLKPTEAYRRVLNSTGWLAIRSGFGRGGSATVWIIDAKRRLAITCWHCVNKGPFVIYFPVKRNGDVVTDPGFYVRTQPPAAAKVIDVDRRNDLALIQLSTIPAGTAELPLALKSASPGEAMYTVGGKPQGSDGLWQFATGRVRLVTVQKNAIGFRGRMLQGEDGGNRGNSGGAWVNDRGEVIAVVEGSHRSARSLSVNVDVQVIRAFYRSSRRLLNPKTAEDYLRRGRRYVSLGRLVDALDDFQASLNLDEGNGEAHEERAKLYFQAGDWENAVREFDAAIDGCRENVRIHALRGMALHHLGRVDDAIDSLTQAITINTDRLQQTELLEKRGDFYLESRQYESAVADFTNALKTAVQRRRSYRTTPSSRYASYSSRSKKTTKRGELQLARATARFRMADYKEAAADIRAALPQLYNLKTRRRAVSMQALCEIRLRGTRGLRVSSGKVAKKQVVRSR
ncbi:MAG: tetratricopeptide repeat-containing serine protease family protein [Planctomycetaceae bacterium]